MFKQKTQSWEFNLLSKKFSNPLQWNYEIKLLMTQTLGTL